MKFIQIGVTVLFFVLILLPLLFFNSDPDAISLIDNRALAESPLTAEGDFTENVEQYVNDRIGFRYRAISMYTLLCDRVFGEMVHPAYSYGKNGYVFGEGITTGNSFGDYHIVFADWLLEAQNYCESRGVPFLFVFNPAKPAVYTDQIADGIFYNREWVELFFSELDQRGIHYIDNTETMQSLSVSGVEGFNKKYDANHWNSLGAFYGVNRILEALQERCPTVHVNDLSEFTVRTEHKTTLQVSDFPIDEDVPLLIPKLAVSDISGNYQGLSLHPSYRYFACRVNEARLEEGTPRALVFQGSYMNSYGAPFLANAFGEYIAVHDYQNVIDLPYYMNIFNPDCVVLEVAEYTLSNGYFSSAAMQASTYAPALETLPAESVKEITDLAAVTVETGELLSTVILSGETDAAYVYLALDRVYDMKKTEKGYCVTLPNAVLDAHKGSMRILTVLSDG